MIFLFCIYALHFTRIPQEKYLWRRTLQSSVSDGVYDNEMRGMSAAEHVQKTLARLVEEETRRVRMTLEVRPIHDV